MKTKLLIVLAVAILASCSAPKYAYKFDYHDYNAGRKQKDAAKEVASNPGPVAVQPEVLVAEADVMAPSQPTEAQVAPSKPKASPLMMTKAERKEMVKDLKAAVKKITKAPRSGDVVQKYQAGKAMDHDLKMALIWLIISIVAGVLYTISPWIAYIVGLGAFIIAVYFFIKWLMRQ